MNPRCTLCGQCPCLCPNATLYANVYHLTAQSSPHAYSSMRTKEMDEIHSIEAAAQETVGHMSDECFLRSMTMDLLQRNAVEHAKAAGYNSAENITTFVNEFMRAWVGVFVQCHGTHYIPQEPAMPSGPKTFKRFIA